VKRKQTQTTPKWDCKSLLEEVKLLTAGQAWREYQDTKVEPEEDYVWQVRLGVFPTGIGVVMHRVNGQVDIHEGGANGRLSASIDATRKPGPQPVAVIHRIRSQTASPIDPITSSSEEAREQPTKEQETAEVAAVLATERFKRSPKLSRLLSYLCEKYFSGEVNGLKEYCIAVDVLGRDSGFDPQLDSAVRVDAHYLRKRLSDCYAAEARDHRVQIVLPKGQYIPQFLLRSEAEISAPARPQDEEADVALPVNRVDAGEGSRERPIILNLKRRWYLLALAGATVGVLLSITVAQVWLRYTKGGAGLQNGPVEAASTYTTADHSAALPSEPEAIRILAGQQSGSYVDKEGRVWLPDRYFVGGSTFFHGSHEIVRTQDPDMFRRGREGEFVYDIPLKPGSYELHLYFAETGVDAEGLRSVSLSINGVPTTTVDVASDAGGADTAMVKVFENISPAKDGLLHLAFQGDHTGFVNALEILPGAQGKMLPVRLTMQENAYRDHQGRIWMPDQYFLSGRLSAGKKPIEDVDGAADPELYSKHRFGNFTYSIPVVEGGKYTVTLHFAETWFTAPNSLGGIGSRVFDVYCNGQTLLKDFDILKEAGGVGNRPVVKVFHNIPSSAQGKLNLTFVPTKNYAEVSAIEVSQE
jgi:Malectin domain